MICFLLGKDGLVPVRQSASTLTQSTSASSSSLGPRGSTGSTNIQDFGQEQEVNSLLIIDQHTFEVRIRVNVTENLKIIIP